jgi:hypothetical protein
MFITSSSPLLLDQVLKTGGVIKDTDFLATSHEATAQDVSQNKMDYCLGHIMDGTAANRKALKQLEVRIVTRPWGSRVGAGVARGSVGGAFEIL